MSESYLGNLEILVLTSNQNFTQTQQTKLQYKPVSNSNYFRIIFKIMDWKIIGCVLLQIYSIARIQSLIKSTWMPHQIRSF